MNIWDESGSGSSLYTSMPSIEKLVLSTKKVIFPLINMSCSESTKVPAAIASEIFKLVLFNIEKKLGLMMISGLPSFL